MPQEQDTALGHFELEKQINAECEEDDRKGRRDTD